jgi:hypothetical protein
VLQAIAQYVTFDPTELIARRDTCGGYSSLPLARNVVSLVYIQRCPVGNLCTRREVRVNVTDEITGARACDVLSPR